jgi:hypothetical protein
MEFTLIKAGPGVLSGVCAFIAGGMTEGLSLAVQHLIEGLFDGLTYHVIEVALNAGFINFNDVAQVLLCVCRCYCLL